MQMRIMKHIYLWIAVMSSSLLLGQEDLTLTKAIAIGLENNFQIKIAEQYIEIAENNDTWARAGRTPTVDLSGTFSNTFIKDNNPASFLQGTFYNGSLGASANANYVLYAGGRIRVAKDQLSVATSRERLNQESSIHDLMRQIYQQYYDVLLQKERNLVLRSNYALSQDRLVYENTKKEYGASNSFNITQFESALLSDSLNLINQQQLIAIAERTLYNTLDIDGDVDYQYPERLSVTEEDINVPALKSTISERNYTLKSLDMLASINRLNTQLAEAAKRPTVSLNAGIGFAENAFKFFGENPNTGMDVPLLFSNRINGSFGAQASWNLYDGNVRNTDIQNAKIQEEIDQMTIAEAQVNLSNQVDILASNYQNQRKVLTLSDQQINLAATNLEIALERFKSGQITSLDYRNLQTQYLNAAFAKVNAIYNLIITKSEIDYLVGRYE